MRSLPIFLAWVSTWRYRLSLAATPTVNRSVTITPFVAVCNTLAIVPALSGTCAGPLRRPTLCSQLPGERSGVEVVDEGAPAVDLDHRQPFSVPLLELRDAGDVDLVEVETVLGAHLCERRSGVLAEVAALGVKQNDLRHAQRRGAGGTIGSPGARGRTSGSPAWLGIEPTGQRRLGDSLDRQPVGGQAHR